ncbi:MAG TPA: tRNA-dihydrouridine synthase family protein, partial [Bacteroidetes bacterium]|nr:tRNA-dihydrouridine synthase family protein [Bacteroidota bacterium]
MMEPRTRDRGDSPAAPEAPGTRWFDRRPLVALAPMEAVTNRPYRLIVRRLAPEVILYTEFTNASGLIRGGERVWKMVEFTDEERPIIVQLYDHDIDALGEATREVVRRLRPDGVDLNMGCPVRKVVRRGAGCGMMADPEHAARCVARMVEEADGVPVTIKTRLGIADKREVIELA